MGDNTAFEDTKFCESPLFLFYNRSVSTPPFYKGGMETLQSAEIKRGIRYDLNG